MTSVRLKGFKGIDKALDKMARTVRADVLERVAEDSADRMLADYKAGTHPTIRRGVRVRTVDKAPTGRDLRVRYPAQTDGSGQCPWPDHADGVRPPRVRQERVQLVP